jgi:predicted nucleic acid-binding protein
MSGGYVFDTEAIVAFRYTEPGHEAVADLLAEVFDGASEWFLDETNASDVFSLVAQLGGVDETSTDPSLRDADRDLRALERRGVRIVSADRCLATEVNTDGDISLADVYAVALAHDHDAILVAGVTMTSMRWLSRSMWTDSGRTGGRADVWDR